MNKIAIVYPYVRTGSSLELLFPPLGAATLAGQLRRRGIEVKIFDCTFSSLDAVHAALQVYGPSIVGIYSMVTMTAGAFQMAKMVRESMPEILTVAGGPMPTLYPQQYAIHFDAVFRGEVDESFPRFCQDYLAAGGTRDHLGGMSLETYEGLFAKIDALSVDNAPAHYDESAIASFPLPERNDFDHRSYQEFWLAHDGSKTASIITTLGCPFSCDFCSRPVFGSVFRRRNLDAVFEEIDRIKRLGYNTLWIADDNFTLHAAFLKDFCERIADLDMNWSCLSRVTGLTEATARMMKRAGCRRVYLGLESGSSATLRLMKKQATLEEGMSAVRLFHRVGIETAAFFIVGYPGETASSIESTFRYALTLPLDAISFNVPFPLPGSSLFDRVSGIDPTKDWSTENEVTFVYKTEFDQAWLRRRIDETMLAFSQKARSIDSADRSPTQRSKRRSVLQLR